MKKQTLIACLLCLLLGCVTAGHSKKKGTVILGQSGIMIPEYGLTVGVRYAPELEQLVPGYQVITIALTNNSLNQIRMDPLNDEWVVQTKSKKVKAINNLSLDNPQAWLRLPEEKRDIMEYPFQVPIGYTQTFDIFVKDSHPISQFNAINYTNAATGLTFKILNTR